MLISLDCTSDLAFLFIYLPPCMMSLFYFNTVYFLIWILKQLSIWLPSPNIFFKYFFPILESAFYKINSDSVLT